MKIKLFVSAGVTSRAQLRIRYAEREKHTFFECGIDMVGTDTLIANVPPVHARSFVELAERVLIWKKYVNNEDMEIREVYICDDTQAEVTTPDYFEESQIVWDGYHELLKRRMEHNRAELAKNAHAFDNLVWNGEKSVLEGEINIQ